MDTKFEPLSHSLSVSAIRSIRKVTFPFLLLSSSTRCICNYTKCIYPIHLVCKQIKIFPICISFLSFCKVSQFIAFSNCIAVFMFNRLCSVFGVVARCETPHVIGQHEGQFVGAIKNDVDEFRDSRKFAFPGTLPQHETRERRVHNEQKTRRHRRVHRNRGEQIVSGLLRNVP